jgi:HTH-type transcriptional regulator/antitoxin HipB
MSDLEKYINKRKKQSQEFADNFENGYKEFKIGLLLKEARKKAGMTQEELALLINTKKTAISRIEKHGEDIRFSTILKIAKALNIQLELRLGSHRITQ